MNTYINELFNLEKKIVLIIGAGGHICSALAEGFARSGCSIIIADLRLEKALTVKKDIMEKGFKNVFAFELDVSKKNDHQKVLDEIINSHGQLDILINGAGINGATPFLNIDLKEWYSILDSQITGTFLACQVFGKHMLENKSGNIINISSASAGPPLSKAFTYSVAKAGIKNLTQNLAREWGTKGIRVNALRPGFFPTEWNRKNFIDKDREQALLAHTPMKRFGEPKELVGACLWLASEASGFVTGAEIAVDGGYSCMTV